MKRIIAAFCAVILLCLGACARRAEPSAEFVPTETARPAAEPTTAPDEPPVLSPGAATESQRSGLMQPTEDGTLYASIARAEGISCLYDLIPEDMGSIAGFIVADDGIYVAVSEFYYSMDPASLWFLPGDGSEARLLSDDVASNGIFCLAGDCVFCYQYGGGLMRIDLTDGSEEVVLPDGTYLLSSDGGFFYYQKEDGVYRNDSTMTAEAKVFDNVSVNRLFFDDNGLYDLTFTDQGTVAVVELRGVAGTLRSSVTLDEATDNIWLHDGRIYAPQPGAGEFLVLDAATGEALEHLPLTEAGSYCLIHCVTDDALYYETYLDEVTSLYRVALDGSGTEEVGPVLRF